MNTDINRKTKVDYLLVFLITAISGMPFFNGDLPLMLVFGVSLLVFIFRKKQLYPFYFFILFAFVILVLLHSLRENYFPMNTYIGMAFKISAAYFVVITVNQNFTKLFVNIIVFFSIISYFFFIPLVLSPALDGILNGIGIVPPFEPYVTKSLLLYHLNLDRPEGLYRNCGPFWEPAAFGGYLLIALMFNMAEKGNIKGRKNIILIITLISTLSTTIFVLLSILMFFYFFFSQKFIVKLFTVPVILTVFGIAFVQLPFLQEKMMKEWRRGDLTYEMRHNDLVGHSRLSSAIADYKDFIKYPVIGRGMFPTTYFDARDILTRHNGLTKQIAQFGIIGVLLYFIPIFRTFNRLVLFSNLKNALGTIFFIMILGMGIAEVYFDKVFFWGLVFLHLVLVPQTFSTPETQESEKLRDLRLRSA
ncbi:hypothetical protein [Catalinimonas niigatensis]|uniref:hypothetical protein n=1 Tax=Catalinimonas niigatensis TaxID=1397264 RepID=UPI0026657D0F|nr:hypothetical protein [Catalinimonas niigatensis]WPP50276.1 hypothetical protein PZB72_26785 [Catalinimonas niigatensis]